MLAHVVLHRIFLLHFLSHKHPPSWAMRNRAEARTTEADPGGSADPASSEPTAQSEGAHLAPPQLRGWAIHRRTRQVYLPPSATPPAGKHAHHPTACTFFLCCRCISRFLHAFLGPCREWVSAEGVSTNPVEGIHSVLKRTADFAGIFSGRTDDPESCDLRWCHPTPPLWGDPST